MCMTSPRMHLNEGDPVQQSSWPSQRGVATCGRSLYLGRFDAWLQDIKTYTHTNHIRNQLFFFQAGGINWFNSAAKHLSNFVNPHAACNLRGWRTHASSWISSCNMGSCITQGLSIQHSRATCLSLWCFSFQSLFYEGLLYSLHHFVVCFFLVGYDLIQCPSSKSAALVNIVWSSRLRRLWNLQRTYTDVQNCWRLHGGANCGNGYCGCCNQQQAASRSQTRLRWSDFGTMWKSRNVLMCVSGPAATFCADMLVWLTNNTVCFFVCSGNYQW